MPENEIIPGTTLLWDPPLGGGTRAVTVLGHPSPIDGLTEVEVAGYTGEAYAYPSELRPIGGQA